MKQVILVRKDLGMGKGKIAAQACHASLGAFRKAVKRTPEVVKRWEQGGEAKIVVKVDLKTMIEFKGWADGETIPSYMVQDAGRTQLEPGTKTALAIGPAEAEKLKPTEELQLM
ncbi:MAG: peptidyl-tRNA hydrolase [Candidatus Altiarchaeota archaeon]|nr:peptidyl-tRNA hydrolase [Candidatus Altiarchaeota archaeon]